jgi:hypothetical protein
VLDVDLPLAVDVISDMVTSSLLTTSDVDNERGVILEEIAMHDDDPTDAVHDTFAEVVWPDSPLGRPVLGTVESIQSLSRTAIAGYYRRRYRPESLVVAAAGNVDHAALVRLVKKAFAHVPVAEEAQVEHVDRTLGVAPGVDADDAGVGVVAGERVDGVGETALLPYLLEEPGGHAATQDRIEHTEREPTVVEPVQAGGAEHQVGLLDWPAHHGRAGSEPRRATADPRRAR